MSNTCKNYSTDGGDTLVIGGKIVILGTVEGGPVAFQAQSTATTIADLKTDFNALLTKLIDAGIMATE